MFTKKTLGLALAGALALGAFSGSALATPVNVNGVHFDSSSKFDLTIQSLNLRESSVSNVGDTLMGYGQIGSINGSNNFCTDCDLSFTFMYKVSSINGNQVVFDNGMFQFYTSAAGSFDFGDPTSASGTEFATLMGHTFENPNTGAMGELFATINGTTSNPTIGSGGFGLLDATGGPAARYFDSNTVSDGQGGFADFNVVSSFLSFPADGCSSTPSADPADLCHYPIEGNGSLTGKTAIPTAVPEPGPAGILGLGLAALGLFMRKRRNEAQGRV